MTNYACRLVYATASTYDERKPERACSSQPQAGDEDEEPRLHPQKATKDHINHCTMKFVFLSSLFAAAASASDGVESNTMLRGPRPATIATDADGDTPTSGVPDFMQGACEDANNCNTCKK
ncbi:hypothetical protein THAOC_15191 [Thalassiosira oceanica]|uniref:Uncharacterized protein n=1 Tax=Thalassiosira oceanica TaxID=159749 RepID=K0SFH1_THAOC|nr:hypothetical protein THAOC_15191 [Thalassiosira oceanica]|eukprot:EJK64105.1 hypothetical protein THAOC_15191 [Thalassiosira oceanica]